ncbi:MAG: hypothetical protein R3D34_11870 [Nitratireductor sp.]
MFSKVIIKKILFISFLANLFAFIFLLSTPLYPEIINSLIDKYRDNVNILFEIVLISFLFTLWYTILLYIASFCFRKMDFYMFAAIQWNRYWIRHGPIYFIMFKEDAEFVRAMSEKVWNESFAGRKNKV